MKRMLLILMLVPFAFAAWEGIAGMSIVLSATILAILYMIGFGFSINELQLTAKEEFFQLIALMVMLATLVGANGLINSISTNAAFAPDSDNLQNASKAIITNNIDQLTSMFRNIEALDLGVSKEGSKAGQCNIMGIGYSISGCGGFSMLATPLSMSGGIMGFAITELSAMRKLLDVSSAYALNFILPLGIILRTFKITRGAGGFLIALAVSMHIFLPMGVIFNEMLGATFVGNVSASAEYTDTSITTSVESCNPTDKQATAETDNSNPAVKSYDNLRADIRKYLYQILIRGTLGPVLGLLVMMAGLRALSAIAGADVDVSAISRFT
ncbi:MAG TPA: hypothetical protein VLD37_04275 [Candidatus Bilamarchaeum sp.]|nr:hypothetical protein [Candidatus Bilamarchaeum sp.]